MHVQIVAGECGLAAPPRAIGADGARLESVRTGFVVFDHRRPRIDQITAAIFVLTWHCQNLVDFF